MDKKHVGNRASNYIRSKGRIVAVETCTSNGYYVQGIKGGHPFEKVPGIGHYNGYGAIKVYEKYQRSIYLVVSVYRDNGTSFAVQIDVKAAIMDHYGYKRYSDALLKRAIADLRGKKIYVYYDDVDRVWKLSYPAESLWYSEFVGSGKKYDVCIVVNRNVYNDKKDDKYPLVASACFHEVFNERFKNKAYIGQNFKGVNIDEILLTREFLSEYGL